MQQMWSTGRRRLSGALAAVLAVSGAVLVAPMFSGEASAASAKITICHRTHSVTNPYRKITVSQNAITRNHGHGDHRVTNGNPDVFDATFTYASNNKIWGDVIPGSDSDGLPFNGASNIALNWTAAGKAIFFSTACAGLTAKEFYDIEIAAGVPEADVLADLNSQAANEDAALLAALGGTFTSDNVSQWDTAVTVTTGAATSVATTTATVNGVLSVGTTSTATGFDYGTSSTLVTYASAAATPSPVTGSDQAVSASLTGLSPGTTYYFRVTGTTNAGSETEGILTGGILSFTTAAATTTTTAAPTTTTTAPTTTTTAPTTTTTAPTTTTTAPTTTTAAAAPTTTTTAPPTTTTTTAPPTTTTTAPPRTTTGPPTTTAPAPTPTPTVGDDTPTPTTSLPATPTPAATPAPAPVPPSTTVGTPTAEGTIAGIVWFDRNHNGVFDGREWVLPGVTVTLDRRAQAASVVDKLAGSAFPAATTAVTGADGSYRFTHLPTGTYHVAAAAKLKGFDYTSDTDGDVDWLVGVAVQGGETGIADFAGLGRGEVMGKMFEKRTNRGLGFASVTCRWGGYDDVVGTADDVPFEVTADHDGTFDMKGVPYGNFTCAGTDGAGRTSAVVTAAVFSPDPVEAPLPVDTLATAELPRTGLGVMPLVALALLSLLAGTVTSAVAARRGGRGPLTS